MVVILTKIAKNGNIMSIFVPVMEYRELNEQEYADIASRILYEDKDRKSHV